MIIVRADSAYYTAEVIAAIRRGGARFSVTVNRNKVEAAIAAIPEGAWTPIGYPRAISTTSWALGLDAEVAGTQYTASPTDKDKAVSARLIVRRVRDLNKKAAQGRASCSRSGATTRPSRFPFELVQAEGHHRDHAVVEQVFADWTDGAGHLPSGERGAASSARAGGADGGRRRAMECAPRRAALRGGRAVATVALRARAVTPQSRRPADGQPPADQARQREPVSGECGHAVSRS